MTAGGAPDSKEERLPHILVVDDDFLIRLTIVMALRDAGAMVAEAASADEALKYLAAFAVDLVFTDHTMPGSMNGAQLAAQIRAEHQSVDVVVVSGNWQGEGWTEPVMAKPYPLFETADALVRRARGKATTPR